MTLMWPTCSTLRSPCAFFDSSLIFFIIALPLGSSFAPGLIGWVLFDVAMTVSLLGGILGRCCSGTTRRSEFKVMPAKVTHRSLVIVADDGQQSCGTMSPQPTSPGRPSLVFLFRGCRPAGTTTKKRSGVPLVKLPHRDFKSTARRAAGTLWPSDRKPISFVSSCG